LVPTGYRKVSIGATNDVIDVAGNGTANGTPIIRSGAAQGAQFEQRPYDGIDRQLLAIS
jgi:hypothetical protein